MTVIKMKLYLWCSPARLHLWRSALSRVILSLLAVGLVACEQDGSVVLEPQYASELLGSWEGTVSGQRKRFALMLMAVSLLGHIRPGLSIRRWGRVSLAQSMVAGSSMAGSSSWSIEGAENVQPLNLSTTSNIVSFNQNKLVMNSAGSWERNFLARTELASAKHARVPLLENLGLIQVNIYSRDYVFCRMCVHIAVAMISILLWLKRGPVLALATCRFNVETGTEKRYGRRCDFLSKKRSALYLRL